ncbi:hypothetical protein WS67_22335 [Burkholderia singularis]|uniref:Uncharacterized protein n=1 Tax=Burkholderia singularis TaxID=1503053 RepID=A0A103DWF6_9BURK|nr:hypothetical protein WS67_22335 [Burkholderia singularis]SMF99863.1 hypothetical protein BSIN_3050 [Burkholderia singularis]
MRRADARCGRRIRAPAFSRGSGGVPVRRFAGGCAHGGAAARPGAARGVPRRVTGFARAG